MIRREAEDIAYAGAARPVFSRMPQKEFFVGTAFLQKTADYDGQSGLGGKFSEFFFSFEITSIKIYSPK